MGIFNEKRAAIKSNAKYNYTNFGRDRNNVKSIMNISILVFFVFALIYISCSIDKKPNFSEVTYQAEDAHGPEGSMNSEKYGGYTGSGYVEMDGMGRVLEWDNVEVPQDGVYNVVFRYSNGKGFMNPCRVEINGDSILVDAPERGKVYGKYALPLGTYAFCTTTGWNKWMDLAVQMKMKRGKNKLRLTVNNKEGGPCIDKITVSPWQREPIPEFDDEAQGWDLVPTISNKIQAPTFPGRFFNIMDFGAKNDGFTDCVEAFNQAIIACNKAGGGTVIVPSGAYKVCGTIRLKSNVELHLKKNTHVKFSGKKENYLPKVLTTTEGNLCYKSALVYAYQETNIAITGEGPTSIFDGGQTEMVWVDGKVHHFADIQLAPEDRPLPESRPNMIDIFNCKNVLLKNYQIVDSPFWCNLLTSCTNVTVDGVVVNSQNPNNDGIDIQSSTYALIQNCILNTKDDAICLKAGRDRDGDKLGLCENIIIRNNKLDTPTAHLGLGSEMSGGIRNVFVENNGANGKILIKSNYDRGGFVRDIYIRDCEDLTSIKFVFNNYNYRGFYYLPDYSNFYFENLPNLKTLDLNGRPENQINNVQLIACGNPSGNRKYVDGLIIK